MATDDTDLSRAAWRKSARSNNGGACVEVATNLSGVVGVRDSQDPDGPKLIFTSAAWQTFLARVRSGTFDLG